MESLEYRGKHDKSQMGKYKYFSSAKSSFIVLFYSFLLKCLSYIYRNMRLDRSMNFSNMKFICVLMYPAPRARCRATINTRKMTLFPFQNIFPLSIKTGLVFVGVSCCWSFQTQDRNMSGERIMGICHVTCQEPCSQGSGRGFRF